MRLRLAAALLTLLAQPAVAAPSLRDQVVHYRAAHEREIVGQLVDLTRIGSVAANPEGLRSAADLLLGQLRARGFEAQLLAPKAGAPVVFGELKTKGAKRTVVFYAHYDGQPVTLSQWATPPFEPVMRAGMLTANAPVVDWKDGAGALDPEWRLYARAASDDKSSIIAFLAGFDALKASGRKPAVNIKVVWEGEEEANSPHLAEILEAHRDLVAGDVWLIGDGPVHQSRRPLVYFGARGNIGLDMTIYGPVRALHDGHYGNWVPNPAAMAANLIASLRDDEGRILIPGFADDVRPVSAAEQAAIAALPPVEDNLKAEFAIARSEGGEGLTASTMRPALNIRGIRSGQVGAEANNAIPTEATVSIDFRLVPDETADGVRHKLEVFLAQKGWTVVDHTPDIATRRAHPRLMKITWEGGYRALRTDMALPVSRAVIAAAGRATGQPVAVLPMSGGSVPIYLFDEIFHAPVVCLPIANHDNSQHAPNENLRLQNLWDGVNLYAGMMGDLNW